MIYFVCALSAEAAPLIRAFDLEKRRMPYRYEVYESRSEAKVRARLTVSGIGSFHASCAAAFLFGLYPPGPDDLLVNVGLCGASPAFAEAQIGTTFQCGKILAPDGRDSVYPAVRRDIPFRVAALQTSDAIVKRNAETEHSGLLYDMEGYSFAKAAAGFAGPDRILVVKVVSDRLEDVRRLKPEEVYELLAPTAQKFYELAKQEDLSEKARSQTRSEHWKARARKIVSEARVSVSMKDRIFSRVAYISSLLEAYRPSEGDLEAGALYKAVEYAFSEAEEAVSAGRFVKSVQNRFLEAIEAAAEAVYERTVVTTVRPSDSAPFSVLYVEEAVADHPRTQKICAHFPKADVIPIRCYRDVFNRSRQEIGGFWHDHAARALVIARQENIHIYPGAPMCQDHGHRRFYYASFVMNCLYDCEYCYLQGMYPSKMPVIFVNPEDVLEQIAGLEATLEPSEEAYVSVSFDTDLCAFEGLLGFVDCIAKFAKEHPRILLEVRTKSAGTAIPIVENASLSEDMPPKNLRFAWSFSPEMVIDRFEHRTAGLEARLSGMTRAIRAGYVVRICFDPLLHIPGGQEAYELLVDRVMQTAQEAARSIGRNMKDCVADVSVGPFRIGSDQLAGMRRVRTDSCIVLYPYEIEEHTARYPKEIEEALLQAVRARVATYVPEEQIFCWDSPVKR